MVLDLNHFINIPWRATEPSLRGCQCWGLVQLYYDIELDIELPDLTCVQNQMHLWQRVSLSEVQLGDVLLFRVGEKDRHVGIAIDMQKMLHVEVRSTSCIEDYRGIKWKDKLLNAYRYKM